MTTTEPTTATTTGPTGPAPIATVDSAGPLPLAPGRWALDANHSSVGFWIRRMAHETLIHRVDAEQVAGLELAPIDEDLALDGIDEFLDLFIGFFSRKYPEEYGSALQDPDCRPLAVSADGSTWTLTTSETGVEVARSSTADVAGSGPASVPEAAVTVSGAPAEVLLWLWVRTDDAAVHIEGDEQALAQLKALRKEATQ